MQDDSSPESGQEPDTPAATVEETAGADAAPDAAAAADARVTGEAPLTVEELRARLTDAEARAADNWDKLLRAGAEQENIRKRSEREIEQARRYALERFASDLLGVIDSLELGLKSAAESGAGAEFLDGMSLTLRMLNEACARHGIEVIDPEGEPFDPNFHEAMSSVPSPEHQPNTVVSVMQKGYRLNDRLLRAAMVVVAKAAD